MRNSFNSKKIPSKIFFIFIFISLIVLSSSVLAIGDILVEKHPGIEGTSKGAQEHQAYVSPNSEPGVKQADEGLKFLGRWNENKRLFEKFVIKEDLLFGISYDFGFCVYNVTTGELLDYYDRNYYLDIVVVDNFAYLTNLGTNGLYVFNISNPNEIHYDGSFISTSLRVFEYTENYLLVLTALDQFALINITNPTNPTTVYVYSIPAGLTPTITLNNSKIYGLDNSGWFHCFSINMTTITPLAGFDLISELPAGLDSFEDIVVQADAVYVSLAELGLAIINCTNASNPIFKSVYTQATAWFNNLYLYQNRLFVTSNDVVMIINAQNPFSLVFQNTFTATRVRDIVIENNTAYINYFSADFSIMNVENSFAITLIADWFLGGISQDVVSIGEYTFVANFNNLIVLNTSLYGQATIAKVIEMDYALTELVLVDNYLYGCSFTGYFYVFDISNPSTTELISSIKVTDQYFDITFCVEDIFAYMLTDTAVIVLGIINPYSIAVLGSFDLLSVYSVIDVKDEFVFIGGNNIVPIKILDVSNPASISLAWDSGFSYELDYSRVDDFSIYRNKLYAACYNSIQVFDITDPENPSTIYSIDKAGDLSNNGYELIAVNADYIYSVSNLKDALFVYSRNDYSFLNQSFDICNRTDSQVESLFLTNDVVITANSFAGIGFIKGFAIQKQASIPMYAIVLLSTLFFTVGAVQRRKRNK